MTPALAPRRHLRARQSPDPTNLSAVIAVLVLLACVAWPQHGRAAYGLATIYGNPPPLVMGADATASGQCNGSAAKLRSVGVSQAIDENTSLDYCVSGASPNGWSAALEISDDGDDAVCSIATMDVELCRGHFHPCGVHGTSPGPDLVWHSARGPPGTAPIELNFITHRTGGGSNATFDVGGVFTLNGAVHVSSAPQRSTLASPGWKARVFRQSADRAEIESTLVDPRPSRESEHHPCIEASHSERPHSRSALVKALAYPMALGRSISAETFGCSGRSRAPWRDAGSKPGATDAGGPGWRRSEPVFTRPEGGDNGASEKLRHRARM